MSPAAAQLDAVRPPDAGAWTELLRARRTGPLAFSHGTAGFGTGTFACEAGMRTIRHERGRSSVRTTLLPVAIKSANDLARGWSNHRIAASRDAGQVVLNEFVASLDRSEEVVTSTPCPRPDGVAIEAARNEPYVFMPLLTIASRQCRGVAPARLNPGGQLSCRVPDQVLRHSAHCTGIIEKPSPRAAGRWKPAPRSWIAGFAASPRIRLARASSSGRSPRLRAQHHRLRLPAMKDFIMSARRLRARMAETGLVHIMAAHSPLSAILAEEAGFDGLWASGFELAALYGLADMSLISMAQHLDMLRSIAGRTTLPIVADIDTGYGNAINVIHAIGEYERAGASAVVIEDKTFPKVTSLVAGGRQELLRIEEFQGKLEAAVATRRNPDFLVIARTEALIAGLGETEALRRALAYTKAGADMILIHSKKQDASEIESFSRAWTGAVPLVVVPNAYPDLDARRVRALGNIRMMIYGNYGIRAAATCMQETFRRIIADGGVQNVHKDILPVEEIFRLQRTEGIKAAEARFLR
ncbi:isocitrate lyase/phosphoenolpyruvate mutase family protein [Bradyrhizobium sp. CCBAU 21365]|uniref:isocitrate lyase/phosphoenolpyruvate mutase family protein n=1 Tax=Bradyrhizobium sp. CCBAU 21365 TaxID=1325083 RepID=UPI001FEE2DB7|nr:isocitrate lyase/phosphoenolpyruvate mutase family protein [Bradyrhizobium sp. CCBAU 21365]